MTNKEQVGRTLDKISDWINTRGEAMLRTKLFLCGVSIFISLVIWAFVAWDGNTDGSRSLAVQIQYLNLQRGYSMFNNTQKVDIKLSGRINMLSRIEQGDLSAKVDLQGLQPGKYSLPIDIEVPPFVRVKSWAPSTADVEIYRHVERSLPVAWKLQGSPPTGMVVSSVDIKPSEVLLAGPEVQVLAVQALEVIIPAAKIKESASLKLPVVIVGSAGNVDNLTISPREADVAVELEHEILGDRIPVKVSVVGHPAEGLEVESVKVLPESVAIRGRSAAVKRMTSLVLPPVDISGLDQNLHLLLPLQPASVDPEVEISGPDRARVEITLRKKMAAKTFSNVGIMLEGGAGGGEWKISPQFVNITIEGSQTAIEALRSDSAPCELYVDVSNIVTKQLVLPVLVRNLKKDFQVVRIEPEQVTVTEVN